MKYYSIQEYEAFIQGDASIPLYDDSSTKAIELKHYTAENAYDEEGGVYFNLNAEEFEEEWYIENALEELSLKEPYLDCSIRMRMIDDGEFKGFAYTLARELSIEDVPTPNIYPLIERDFFIWKLADAIKEHLLMTWGNED